MVLWLHVHQVNVVLLTPEAVDPAGVEAIFHPDLYSFLSQIYTWVLIGPHYMLFCCFFWHSANIMKNAQLISNEAPRAALGSSNVARK